jgi:hypothetical protein
MEFDIENVFFVIVITALIIFIPAAMIMSTPSTLNQMTLFFAQKYIMQQIIFSYFAIGILAVTWLRLKIIRERTSLLNLLGVFLIWPAFATVGIWYWLRKTRI